MNLIIVVDGIRGLIFFLKITTNGLIIIQIENLTESCAFVMFINTYKIYLCILFI